MKVNGTRAGIPPRWQLHLECLRLLERALVADGASEADAAYEVYGKPGLPAWYRVSEALLGRRVDGSGSASVEDLGAFRAALMGRLAAKRRNERTG